MMSEKGKVLVLGLTGKKGSGKSSCAEVLTKSEFVAYALADPIRLMLSAMFGWTYEQMMDPDLKEIVDPWYGVSPRQMMQFIGTELGQFIIGERFPEFKEKIGRTIWVERLKDFVEVIREDPVISRVVVTDVRFQHEVDYIHSVGGSIIQVVRPGNTEEDEHLSETSVDQITPDFVFINDSETVLELFEKFDAFTMEHAEVLDEPH